MTDARQPLTVGVPRETKPGEHRVALTPDGVRELHHHGVTVLVERDAGAGPAIPDDTFADAGAQIIDSATEVWERAELVVKVKEPQPSEFAHLRPGLVLFTYLHLAAYPEVAAELRAREVTGIAYETVQRADGSLPLLAPMSEVAGRMAPQVGAHFLERQSGGRGVLLGGVPGVAPAHVVVLGAGTVGWSAGRIAAGMGAEVRVVNRSVERLQMIDEVAAGRVTTYASNHATIERLVADADLLIGAVLVPGGRAPVLVSEDMVRSMRPGAVIVDIAVDQGGCIATTHETSHADPVYERHGVLHYAVGNMPGARGGPAPRTGPRGAATRRAACARRGSPPSRRRGAAARAPSARRCRSTRRATTSPEAPGSPPHPSRRRRPCSRPTARSGGRGTARPRSRGHGRRAGAVGSSAYRWVGRGNGTLEAQSGPCRPSVGRQGLEP
ncbi:MAG: alanine dehydrogenase [Actinobacteria bacterium]|nr:alanine dehydrogenase [Actinomycetota bacterium]